MSPEGSVTIGTCVIDPARLIVPQIRIVNPPLWEIGHVAWFQERWCLRQRADGSLGGFARGPARKRVLLRREGQRPDHT